MAISSRQSAVARLRKAVAVYRSERADKLDKQAHELLARLADTPEAGRAFEALKLKDRRAEVHILTGCITTDQLARNFAKRLAQSAELLARLKQLDKDLANLRRYVSEVAKQKYPAPSDLLSTRIIDRPADIAAMKNGLDLIEGRINTHRCVAKKDVLRLGATRKSKIKQAGELAAIGYLAEAVDHVTGRPHLMKVADLATVILRTPVFWDRVGYAARARKRV